MVPHPAEQKQLSFLSSCSLPARTPSACPTCGAGGGWRRTNLFTITDNHVTRENSVLKLPTGWGGEALTKMTPGRSCWRGGAPGPGGGGGAPGLLEGGWGTGPGGGLGHRGLEGLGHQGWGTRAWWGGAGAPGPGGGWGTGAAGGGWGTEAAGGAGAPGCWRRGWGTGAWRGVGSSKEHQDRPGGNG